MDLGVAAGWWTVRGAVGYGRRCSPSPTTSPAQAPASIRLSPDLAPVLVNYFRTIRISIPEPEDNAPAYGHLDRREAPACAGLPVDADPLRTQVLEGRAAVQQLEQEVDLLAEFGGEPPPGLGARAHPERNGDSADLMLVP